MRGLRRVIDSLSVSPFWLRGESRDRVAFEQKWEIREQRQSPVVPPPDQSRRLHLHALSSPLTVFSP